MKAAARASLGQDCLYTLWRAQRGVLTKKGCPVLEV